MKDIKRTVLVTGGAGYIGSACVHALIENGYRVLVIDNLSRGRRERVDSRASFFEIDLLDKDSIESFFDNNKFSAILHLAGLKNVNESELHPDRYRTNNLGGTINLLSAAQRHDVEAIIFSSSAAVYDPLAELKTYVEDSPMRPCNTYGTIKLEEERALRSFGEQFKSKRIVIFRYFNVAGDYGLRVFEEHAENVFPAIARAIKIGEYFSIFGEDYPTRDGTCVRDYIDIRDIVRAHICALKHKTARGIFNLGTSTGHTVKEVATAFNNMSGNILKTKIAPRRKGDAACILADSSKAKSVFGWKPTHNLEDMVRATLDIYVK